MDGIDGRTRRRALLLVGALADHRLRLTPDKRALMHLTIARAPDRLHIEASADEHPLPPGFWEEVGQAAAVGLVDSWGIDRRRHAAAWFEILTAE